MAEGRNLTTSLSNQLHHFMTIFSNLSNQGATSYSKIKTLRYFRLRSGAHQQETQRTPANMDKKRIRIAITVLKEIKNEFLETADFIDDRLEQECSKEKMIVEEVIFLFTCLEAKSQRRETFFIFQCQVLKQKRFPTLN